MLTELSVIGSSRWLGVTMAGAQGLWLAEG